MQLEHLEVAGVLPHMMHEGVVVAAATGMAPCG